MTPYLITLSFIFGLVIGSFLNVVVSRVPAGISLNRPSQCPRCDAPVRPWQNVPVISWLALRARCASCAEPISARYPLVELATGIAFAAVTAIALTDTDAPVLVALLWFAATSIALTLIDLDTRRLPTPIIIASLVAIGALFIVEAVMSRDPQPLIRAAIGAGALWAFYALLRLVRPGGMGAGDVRLAALVGLVLAWFGWDVLIIGAFGGFVFGGLYGIVLLLTGRAKRSSAVPFGPWMLAGAWLGLIAGRPLAAAYLTLFAG